MIENCFSCLPYSFLVLAMGATPRKLALSTTIQSDVLYVRTLEDAKRLAAECAGKSVAIIGAGMLGWLANGDAGIEAKHFHSCFSPRRRIGRHFEGHSQKCHPLRQVRLFAGHLWGQRSCRDFGCKAQTDAYPIGWHLYANINFLFSPLPDSGWPRTA
jgi:hypothetical protein